MNEPENVVPPEGDGPEKPPVLIQMAWDNRDVVLPMAVMRKGDSDDPLDVLYAAVDVSFVAGFRTAYGLLLRHPEYARAIHQELLESGAFLNDAGEAPAIEDLADEVVERYKLEDWVLDPQKVVREGD